MKRIAVLAASLVACGSAHAIGIGVKAGTTGIGIDAAMSVFPLVDARIGWSGLKWGYDQNTSNVSYKGDLKLNNLNALLDFHPMGPLFRLTGGVVFNSNKYDATGTPNSGPGSFNATVETGLSAPQCTALQSQVAAEQTSLQDSLKRFKVYPVLNIGVTIGF
jgi:hypothetical protein